MSDAPMPPAGWYPDPDNATVQRYWDGAAWTDQPALIVPSGKPAFGAAVLGHVRGWFGRLTVLGWIVFVVLALLSLVAFGSTGFGGGLIMLGLIALITGVYALGTRRRSWAGIAGRKIAAGVLVGGLLTTFIGTAAYSAANPRDASSSVAETPEPASEPTLRTTPPPTPTAEVEPDAPDNVIAAKDGPAVKVADSSATQMTALALLDTLPVKGRAPKTGYEREAKFGTAWLDVDRNGCDTRNDTLARDLEPEVKSGPCKVTSGTLLDPYTGKTIDFVRGNTTSLAVQIDHVVSLMNAWETGAQQLTQAQRISLANDPINLFAVDGPTNGQKGAGDAATWLPPKKDFRCMYVARQVSVKATYGLWVTQPEHDAITRILNTCPDEPAVTSGFTPAAQRAPAPAPAPEPAPAPAPAPEPAPAPTPAPVYYENCDAVRAAGAAPIHAGDPGYSSKLDRDGDGTACE